MSKSNMTVLEIVKEYLLENKYDGLYKESLCECSIDNLMCCCGEILQNCTAGYKVSCGSYRIGEK